MFEFGLQLNPPAGGGRLSSKPHGQGPDIQSTDSRPLLSQLKMPTVNKEYNG